MKIMATVLLKSFMSNILPMTLVPLMPHNPIPYIMITKLLSTGLPLLPPKAPNTSTCMKMCFLRFTTTTIKLTKVPTLHGSLIPLICSQKGFKMQCIPIAVMTPCWCPSLAFLSTNTVFTHVSHTNLHLLTILFVLFQCLLHKHGGIPAASLCRWSLIDCSSVHQRGG